MKIYEKPEIEYVALIAEEEIAGGIGGETGTASSMFN